MQDQKIPATVITGFLGAGKTSLIRHALGQAGGRRIALIINEFGDLGIDREVLQGCGDEACDETDIVELANGCICCTVADDFVPAIEALLAREPAPEHILIETSGLALPKPLVAAFNWPEIRTRLTVDGVVAVVDAPALAEGRFADDEDALQAQREADEALDHESPLAEVFEDQIGCADMVILNKTDLLAADGAEAGAARMAPHLRPGARVVKAAHGRVPPDLLLGLDAGAEADLASRRSHHDDLDEPHDHDEFESFVMAPGTIDDPAAFAARLGDAAAVHGLLRAKGFLDVAGRRRRLVVQAVGSRIDRHFDRDWRAGEARDGRLVVIGLAPLDRAAIEAAIAGQGA